MHRKLVFSPSFLLKPQPARATTFVVIGNTQVDEGRHPAPRIEEDTENGLIPNAFQVQKPAYARILEPIYAAWREQLDYIQLLLASRGNRRAIGPPPGVASESTCYPDADLTRRLRDRPYISLANRSIPKEDITGLQNWVIQTLGRQMGLVKNPSITTRRDLA